MTPDQRRAVLDEALSWERTKYHDAAAIKRTATDVGGVDCAWLVYEVYLNAGIIEPFEMPDYSPQVMLHRNEELYLNHVLERAVEIAEADALPGDLALYKIGRIFAHGAIVIEPGWPNVLHADKSAGMVVRGLGDQGRLADRLRKLFTMRSPA